MQINIGLQECYWQVLLYHQEICFKIQDWRELFKKFLIVEVGGLTLETQSWSDQVKIIEAHLLEDSGSLFC